MVPRDRGGQGTGTYMRVPGGILVRGGTRLELLQSQLQQCLRLGPASIAHSPRLRETSSVQYHSEKFPRRSSFVAFRARNTTKLLMAFVFIARISQAVRDRVRVSFFFFFKSHHPFYYLRLFFLSPSCCSRNSDPESPVQQALSSPPSSPLRPPLYDIPGYIPGG